MDREDGHDAKSGGVEHDRILRTPREVRRALAYVLNNARRHGVRLARAFDLFASGPWFDGWRGTLTVRHRPSLRPVATARTWLLTVGWRRHGRIDPGEVPRGRGRDARGPGRGGSRTLSR